MAMQIDKDTAGQWIDAIHNINTRFLHETHSPDGLMHVEVMFANLTANLLCALREIDTDDRASAELVHSAAQGICYGLITALLGQAPPPGPLQRREKN